MNAQIAKKAHTSLTVQKHRHFNYLRSLDAIRSLEVDEIIEEEEVT